MNIFIVIIIIIIIQKYKKSGVKKSCCVVWSCVPTDPPGTGTFQPSAPIKYTGHAMGFPCWCVSSHHHQGVRTHTFHSRSPANKVCRRLNNSSCSLRLLSQFSVTADTRTAALGASVDASRVANAALSGLKKKKNKLEERSSSVTWLSVYMNDKKRLKTRHDGGNSPFSGVILTVSRCFSFCLLQQFLFVKTGMQNSSRCWNLIAGHSGGGGGGAMVTAPRPRLNGSRFSLWHSSVFVAVVENEEENEEKDLEDEQHRTWHRTRVLQEHTAVPTITFHIQEALFYSSSLVPRARFIPGMLGAIWHKRDVYVFYWCLKQCQTKSIAEQSPQKCNDGTRRHSLFSVLTVYSEVETRWVVTEELVIFYQSGAQQDVFLHSGPSESTLTLVAAGR